MLFRILMEHPIIRQKKSVRLFLKETGHKQLPRRRMLHNIQLTIVPQPSNSPVPPSTPSHQSQQPSSSQCDLLEAKAQELQAAWESDVQKAFRKQRLRFDNCALVEDFQGCLTYQCSNGENTIVKPFSPCRNLRAQKIVDHSTQKEYIKYTFDTPTGEHKSVIVDATCSALHRLQFATRQRIYCLRTSSSYRLWRADCPVYRSYTRFHSTTDKILSRWYFSEKHWDFKRVNGLTLILCY